MLDQEFETPNEQTVISVSITELVDLQSSQSAINNAIVGMWANMSPVKHSDLADKMGLPLKDCVSMLPHMVGEMIGSSVGELALAENTGEFVINAITLIIDTMVSIRTMNPHMTENTFATILGAVLTAHTADDGSVKAVNAKLTIDKTVDEISDLSMIRTPQIVTAIYEGDLLDGISESVTDCLIEVLAEDAEDDEDDEEADAAEGNA